MRRKRVEFHKELGLREELKIKLCKKYIIENTQKRASKDASSVTGSAPLGHSRSLSLNGKQQNNKIRRGREEKEKKEKKSCFSIFGF